MKKKRRYFSMVAVILLLANNTSGATQVIAEELSKNVLTVEKQEQIPPSSNEIEQSQELTDEEKDVGVEDKDKKQETNQSEEIGNDKQVTSSETKAPEETKKNDEITTKTNKSYEEKSGIWGTSPWSFDEGTGTLTVEPGQLSENDVNENQAPWNRTDDNKVSKDR